MFLLPMILLLFSGASAEVVDDFRNECLLIFMNKIPPTVLLRNHHKKICQTRGNIQYYGTLYDTNNKIPVYSAYNFTQNNQLKRYDNWYIEPQLDNYEGKNMEPQYGRRLHNQASYEDYKNNESYERGHLAPVCHAASQGFANATFTLTNAAPQKKKFNKKWYDTVESNMALTLKNHCTQNTAYIITGVVPSNDKINEIVTVPSHFWTAYCCTKLGTNTHISGGAIGANTEESTIYQTTVEDLEIRLRHLYDDQTFSLFHNTCRVARNVPVMAVAFTEGRGLLLSQIGIVMVITIIVIIIVIKIKINNTTATNNSNKKK